MSRRLRSLARLLAPQAAASSSCREPEPPVVFEPSQGAEIVAQFETAGFALIRVLDTDELVRVNAWIDESQASCPAAWLGSRPGSNSAKDAEAAEATALPESGTISYSLPLLDERGPELDSFVRDSL